MSGAVPLVAPYAKGCLALADAEVDLRACFRNWAPGMMSVTVCVGAGRGVGRWQELTCCHAAGVLCMAGAEAATTYPPSACRST